MRGEQVTRLIKILLLLQNRRMGLSVPELAEETGVTHRTIYRDLRIIQDIGAPIVNEKHENTTVWKIINREQWKTGIPLGVAEVAALYIAADLFKKQGVGPWTEALASAVEKIAAAVPGKFLHRIEELRYGVSFSDRGGHCYESKREIVASVVRAVEKWKVLEIHYATPGRMRSVQRKVHPYCLRVHENGLYLVGWDKLRNRISTFLVDRIRMATVSDESFEVPEDFVVDDWFSEAFGVHRGGKLITLKAWATSRVAHLIEEKRWHPSLKTNRSEKGGVDITMKVKDNPELRSWILSYGGDLIVHEPEELARELALEAEQMIRMYAMQRGSRKKQEATGVQKSKKTRQDSNNMKSSYLKSKLEETNQA